MYCINFFVYAAIYEEHRNGVLMAYATRVLQVSSGGAPDNPDRCQPFNYGYINICIYYTNITDFMQFNFMFYALCKVDVQGRCHSYFILNPVSCFRPTLSIRHIDIPFCSHQSSKEMYGKHQPVEIEIVIEYYYFRIKFRQRSFSDHHPFSAGEMPVRFTLRAFLIGEVTSSAR